MLEEMESGSSRNEYLGCRVIYGVDKLECLESKNGVIVEDIELVELDVTERSDRSVLRLKERRRFL